MELSTFVKNYRVEHGLTQKELATRLRVHYRTIENIESGMYVKFKTARKLAKVLGLNPEDCIRALPKTKMQKARYALGLSQEEFAESIGVAEHTVGRWERGRTFPRAAVRPLVEKALGIQLS